MVQMHKLNFMNQLIKIFLDFKSITCIVLTNVTNNTNVVKTNAI